jgi:tetratricopeptide (TPR) repeat protein
LADKLSDFLPEIKELSVKKIAQEKLLEADKHLALRGYENIYVKAKINSALGNYQLAETYFQEILGLTPYWPKTYIDLGRALSREAKFSEAIASYRLAEASLPGLNDSRFNDLHRNILKVYRKVIFQELGNIYFFLKDYPEAEKYYQAAYLSDVNDFTLLKSIADTYYQRGNFDKALEYNARGAKRNPSDYSWPLAISVLYRAKGDEIMSRRFLDEAIKLAPDNEELIKLRGKY